MGTYLLGAKGRHSDLVTLSKYLSFYLSIYLSIYLFIYLGVFLSLHVVYEERKLDTAGYDDQSIYLSFYLSIYLFRSVLVSPSGVRGT